MLAIELLGRAVVGNALLEIVPPEIAIGFHFDFTTGPIQDDDGGTDTLTERAVVFLPGTTGAAAVYEAPAGFDGKIFLSFPTAPTDQTEEGLKEFRALAGKYNFSSQYRAAQVSVYSAVKILVEALKRAGKNLSREELIKSLEGLYEYSTGLTPAITYGPNRRIGAMGAYVVTVDLQKKQFLPASGWIGIN